jgi:hypothetical protein
MFNYKWLYLSKKIYLIKKTTKSKIQTMQIIINIIKSNIVNVNKNINIISILIRIKFTNLFVQYLYGIYNLDHFQ